MMFLFYSTIQVEKIDVCYWKATRTDLHSSDRGFPVFSEVDAREKHKCFIYGLPGDEYHDLLKVRKSSYTVSTGILKEMYPTFKLKYNHSELLADISFTASFLLAVGTIFFQFS